MAIEWFRGTALTVQYDEQRQRVMFVANNGRVPTLEFPAGGFVTASVEHGTLVLTGAFDSDTRIALKIPPDDAQGIARTLCHYLALPRSAQAVTLAALEHVPDGTLVVIEGPCFPFANGPVLENRIALVGVTGRIEHNAPYRVTGQYRRGEREEIRVLGIEHMNPPVTWLDGQSVRVIYAPQRGLIGLAPVPGHSFESPAGILELWLPVDTLVSAAIHGEGLVFEGDLAQTGYGTRVTLAPVRSDDARAIVALLAERLALPKLPRAIAVADIASITSPTLVRIEGTFQPGHFEGANFDGGIQLKRREHFVAGARYRVIGFLYPAFRPQGPHLGYTGPRIVPLALERLG